MCVCVSKFLPIDFSYSLIFHIYILVYHTIQIGEFNCHLQGMGRVTRSTRSSASSSSFSSILEDTTVDNSSSLLEGSMTTSKNKISSTEKDKDLNGGKGEKTEETKGNDENNEEKNLVFQDNVKENDLLQNPAHGLPAKTGSGAAEVLKSLQYAEYECR